MTKEWTGTWDKQGTLCLKYDKVEECIKIQCIFLFYYPVCVNQGTFVREPKVEQQQLKPPPPCPSMTLHLMCQDIMWCLRTSCEVMGHHVMSHDIMSTWCPNLAHCAMYPHCPPGDQSEASKSMTANHSPPWGAVRVHCTRGAPVQCGGCSFWLPRLICLSVRLSTYSGKHLG